MSAGSWLRFVVGILLSLDVLRLAFTSRQVELTTILLGVVFLVLSVLYLVKRF